MSENKQFDVIRNPPVNLQQQDIDLFEKSYKFRVNSSRPIILNNVFIFWQGQMFRKGRVVAESLSTPLFIKKYSRSFFFKCLVKGIAKKRLVKLDKGPYLVVHDEWSGNYFHWLTDVITRLYTVKENLARYTLILPHSFNHSWYTHTLKKFGIVNICWIRDNELFFAKEVLLPTHSAPAGHYHPGLLKNAVNLLVSDELHTINKGKKIYISRQHSPGRKVINEDEVIAFLETEGFTILHTEQFSFKQQISIFSHAELLISIHGAGLVNQMFMKPGSAVLELRKQDNSELYNCYFTLSSVFDHRYFYQGCESDSDGSVRDASIYVDIEKLRKNVALMQQNSIPLIENSL